jgi:hypothetical protein
VLFYTLFFFGKFGCFSGIVLHLLALLKASMGVVHWDVISHTCYSTGFRGILHGVLKKLKFLKFLRK